jgi:hypothetical protein
MTKLAKEHGDPDMFKYKDLGNLFRKPKHGVDPVEVFIDQSKQSANLTRQDNTPKLEMDKLLRQHFNAKLTPMDDWKDLTGGFQVELLRPHTKGKYIVCILAEHHDPTMEKDNHCIAFDTKGGRFGLGQLKDCLKRSKPVDVEEVDREFSQPLTKKQKKNWIKGMHELHDDYKGLKSLEMVSVWKLEPLSPMPTPACE